MSRVWEHHESLEIKYIMHRSCTFAICIFLLGIPRTLYHTSVMIGLVDEG